VQKNLIWLTGLLVLQILFAVGLFWGNAHTAQNNDKRTLFSFEQKEIDRVVISNSSSTVTLNKSDQKWVLPDLQQLPVNENKLSALLDKLTQLNPGWPVATTKKSHPRFEVAEDNFQRKVQLFRNGNLIEEFFVGTTPSFRKGHVRRANDNAIYSVTLNSYELPVDNTQWLDTSLLSAKDITVIRGSDFLLRKNGGKWNLDLVDKNTNTRVPELEGSKADNLASTLKSLRILGVAIEKDIVNESQVKTIEVTGSSNWRYELLEQSKKYYIRRNDIASLFTLSKSDYELLANIDLSQLAKKVPVKTPEL
jgi:hypothetical protein